MFEKALDSLVRESHDLLNRIDKGKKMLEDMSITEGTLALEESGKYEACKKQLARLQNLQFRAVVCIDILNGEVNLIAQTRDEILVAKRLDEKMVHLVEEARKLGAEIESIEEA